MHCRGAAEDCGSAGEGGHRDCCGIWSTWGQIRKHWKPVIKIWEAYTYAVDVKVVLESLPVVTIEVKVAITTLVV